MTASMHAKCWQLGQKLDLHGGAAIMQPSTCMLCIMIIKTSASCLKAPPQPARPSSASIAGVHALAACKSEAGCRAEQLLAPSYIVGRSWVTATSTPPLAPITISATATPSMHTCQHPSVHLSNMPLSAPRGVP